MRFFSVGICRIRWLFGKTWDHKIFKAVQPSTAITLHRECWLSIKFSQWNRHYIYCIHLCIATIYNIRVSLMVYLNYNTSKVTVHATPITTITDVKTRTILLNSCNDFSYFSIQLIQWSYAKISYSKHLLLKKKVSMQVETTRSSLPEGKVEFSQKSSQKELFRESHGITQDTKSVQ